MQITSMFVGVFPAVLLFVTVIVPMLVTAASKSNKVALRVNVKNLVRNVGGNGLIEWVANALEAPGSTGANIFLDRKARTLAVRDDGKGLSSQKEMEDKLCYVYGDLNEKSLNSNFCKGFTTIYTEQSAEVFTNTLHATFLSCDDICIESDCPPVSGFKLVVHLKESSDILHMSDEDIKRNLQGFRTRKGITFNGAIIISAQMQSDKPLLGQDWIELKKGLHVKYGDSYHGFVMYGDAGMRPVRYENMSDVNCGIVCASTRMVDTERSALRYDSREAIVGWFEKEKMARLKKEAANIGNLQKAIEKAKLFLKSKSTELGGAVDEFGPIKDIEDVCKLLRFLSKVATFPEMKNCKVYYDFIFDAMSQAQYSMFRHVYEPSDKEMREFIQKFAGVMGHVFPDLVIGLYIEEGGDVAGGAFLKELDSVNNRVHEIGTVFSYDLTDCEPFIAIFQDLDFIARVKHVSLDKYRVASKALDPGADEWAIKVGEPPKLFEIVEGMRSLSVEDALAQLRAMMKAMDQGAKIVARGNKLMETDGDENQESLIRFEIVGGIPCIVHKSVKNTATIKFNVERQAKKWRDWFVTTRLIMEYTQGQLAYEVVPAIFISNDPRHKNVMVLKHGKYVALSRARMNIPDEGMARALVLFDLALHGLAYFQRPREDRKFIRLKDQVRRALISQPSFLPALFSIVQ